MPSADDRSIGPERPRQFLPVWAGMTFAAWLRLLSRRPPVRARYAGRVAAITAASAANSILSLLESALYGRRVALTRIERPPLFILGHWRSGTTLLHNLLSRDPQFVAPTNYQVAFPSHFLLTERWATRLTQRLIPSRRPMDQMPFAWDLPGEDEIALLLTTLLSPYVSAAFTERPPAVERLDDLRRNLSAPELERWKTAFVSFQRKVTLRAPRGLLLKSPPHTGRIPLLLELFPEAKFIYVVRHPYAVFASTRHLHRVLCEANGFGAGAPHDLDERILETYSRLYQAYHLHRALVPPTRRIELRFEDLESDPVGTLERTYEHLDLPGFSDFRRELERELTTLRSHRKNRFELDVATQKLVYERWRPAFDRYGYEAFAGRAAGTA